MDENFINCTYISRDYAEVDIKDVGNISKFMEKFDQGHQSVIISEDGKFKGLVEQHEFRESLISKKLLILNAGIEYDEDEEKIRMYAAEIFSKTILREIPLLKSGQVIAVAINSLSLGAGYKLNSVEFPPIYWELISDNLAKSVFGNKKILISSTYGNLEHFKEQFEHLANIDIYSGENYFKYQNNYYDMYLCGSYANTGGGQNFNIVRPSTLR